LAIAGPRIDQSTYAIVASSPSFFLAPGSRGSSSRSPGCLQTELFRLGVSGKLKGQAASATERERRIRERPGPSRQVGQRRGTNMSCGSSTNLASMPLSNSA
jgi:hypothetical protein